MLGCEACQAQLLGYLYGALDEPQRGAVADHLADCPACQGALERARHQRERLAAAARSLTAPPRRRDWGRWAIAAVLLLAAVGLLTPFSWLVAARQAAVRQDELVVEVGRLSVAHHQQLTAAATAVDTARTALAAWPGHESRRWQAFNESSRQRGLHVTVRGPATLLPAAPNEYLIQTRDARQQPTTARVSARLRSLSSEAVVREFAALPADRPGDYRLMLPPDLVRPSGERLVLEVEARRDGDTALLRETMEVASPLYATHLVTDRPLYRPGETVRFRSLTLDRFTLRPPEEPLTLIYTLTPPRGEDRELLRGVAPTIGTPPTVRGIGAGTWVVPADAAEGEYTLTVRGPGDRPTAERRRFLVHRYRAPRLHLELDFDRASHGPGDPVTARVRVTRAEGGPVAERPVGAVLRVDGAAGPALTLRTDAAGAVTAACRLPARIERDDATLTLTVDDGGTVETLVRPVPLVLRHLHLAFYPEGGDLTAGLPCRVYFEARTPAGGAADVEGRVVDDTGETVARAVTLRVPERRGSARGLGSFSFTPRSGRRYAFLVDNPASTEGQYPLPEVRTEGVVLHLPEPVVADGAPLRAVIHASAARQLVLIAAARGQTVGLARTPVEPHKPTTVEVPLVPEVGGVVRLTVFEERNGTGPRLTPAAERLAYRATGRRLRLAVFPDRPHYVPGEPVALSFRATDERGTPVPALAAVSVVDRGGLALADDRSRRGLPAHFFLATEVRRPEELESAELLLGDGAEAKTALDHLLGTQGWRRFAEQDPAEFRRRHGPDAERHLALSGAVGYRVTDLAEQERRRLGEELAAEGRSLRERFTTAQGAWTRANVAEDYRERLVALREEARAVEATGAAATARWEVYRGRVVPVLGLALVVLAAASAGVAVARRLGGALPYWAEAAVAVSLLALLAVQLEGGRGSGPLAAQPSLPDEPTVALAVAAPDLSEPPIDPPVLPAVKAAPGRARPSQVRAPSAAPEVAVALPAPRPGPPPTPEVPAVPQTPAEPFVLREYAHARTVGPSEVRTDFTETVYWHPVLVLPDGRGEARFHLSDAVTTFQVAALGHTLDGRLGDATATLAVRQPLVVEAKLPAEVSVGDRLDVPVSVANNTPTARAVSLHGVATGLTVDGPSGTSMRVGPGERGRHVFRYRVPPSGGEATLEFQGRAEPFGADAVRRRLSVVPGGIPVARADSDLLEGTVRRTIELPASWTPGTLRCELELYPSTLADILGSLEGLLREPHGCFEQVASTTYPNLLALDALGAAGGAAPDVERRARDLLARGYARMAALECRQTTTGRREGYEWFGGDAPPHEALTAYGLLQFQDLARLHPVDATMVRRTRDYLLSRRDGRGGFTRNPKALDAFGRAPDDVTNAYITWALTEAGEDVPRERAALAETARMSSDPYLLALAANALLNRGETEAAGDLLRRLALAQRPDGGLDGEKTSITSSAGRDLRIETTSLALLAWLKAPRPAQYHEAVRQAVARLGRQRNPHGGFGTTQATVLALKALLAHSKAYGRRAEAGEVRLYVGGRLAVSRAFPAGVRESIVLTLPEVEKLLQPGMNEIRLELTAQNAFPYTLRTQYRAERPPSAADAPLGLNAVLDRAEVTEGESVYLRVAVANRLDRGVGMAVAVVGLPAGLSLPADLRQLREHVRLREGSGRGPADAFEVRGRELVLYWRDLGPRQRVEVAVELVAEIPGEYRGPASRAYLYYDGDRRHWQEPLRMLIRPRH